jgi:hypothetical protein
MSRRRTRSTGALLALATAAALTLAACGGDSGPRLSRAAFTQKADEECATLKAASDSLRAAQEPGATGKAVTKHLGSAADQLRSLVDQLDALAPPAAIEGQVDELLGVLGQYADGLDALGDRAGTSKTFQQVLDENTDEVNALNDLAQQSSNLVEALGLTGCMLES